MNQRRNGLRRALDEPLWRLGLGAAGVVVTAAALHRDRVGPTEEWVFRVVNDLPDGLYAPTWLVMQCGALGAAPVAGGIAWAAGERRLAAEINVGATVAWALAKVVKRVVKRPRPSALLERSNHRGPEPAGLGYLSGHSGVAVAIALAAWPRLGLRGRCLTAVVAPVVGLARIYVGAHLPLDVVGGASLGVAVHAAVSLVDGAGARRSGDGEQVEAH